MSTRKNFKVRRRVRHIEAAERQAERAARGDARQLERLERNGHGHCKEAERLREALK